MQSEILGASDAESKRPKKWARILQALVNGRTLNRFEAAREYHDTVLNSTVASIQRRGVPICRKDEIVSGYLNAPVRCCRYWLDESERKRARALLAGEGDHPAEPRHVATREEYAAASGR